MKLGTIYGIGVGPGDPESDYPERGQGTPEVPAGLRPQGPRGGDSAALSIAVPICGPTLKSMNWFSP